MPYTVEDPNEIAVYNSKWNALLAHVHSGLGLRDQVRAAIDAWGQRATTPEKPETDPEKRFEQVKAKVDALSKHFAPVIGTVTAWAIGLKPLLNECQANLDGLPLFAVVDDLHSAFARAEKRTLPPAPPVKLDNPELLEGRARWLREVAEIMQRVEAGPQEIGAAIRGLEEVLSRFEQEMEQAKTMGRKGNTSAIRWQIPTHPFVGQPAPRPRPPVRVDPYTRLFE
jgi:hypothetical protein